MSADDLSAERLADAAYRQGRADLRARIVELIVELDEGGPSFLTRRHIDADGLRDLLVQFDNEVNDSARGDR